MHVIFSFFQVWVAVWLSIALFGPVFYFISKTSTFEECLWKTLVILLKQSSECYPYLPSYSSNFHVTFQKAKKEKAQSTKSRLVTILLSITATYVIGDLYCANLTSLLAKPGRGGATIKNMRFFLTQLDFPERPLKSLSELEMAVRDMRYECFIEERSSEAEFLKNGTTQAQRLWALMTKQQRRWVVPSVEKGVALIRAHGGAALIASRETLHFEMQRFGIIIYHQRIFCKDTLLI